MKMDEVKYDFCSRCGALTKDGVCTSCGLGTVPAVSVEECKEEIFEGETVDAVTVVREAEEEVTAGGDVEGRAAAEEEVMYKVPVTAEKEPSVAQVPVQNPYVLYEEQPVNVTQNPYSEYANRTAYTNGAIPSDVPQKKSNGKVWAIVLTCVGVFILLIVMLGVAIFNLVSKIDDSSRNHREEEVWSEDFDDEFSEDEDSEYDFEFDNFDDYNEDYDDTYDEYENFDYEEFYNDIMERAKENQDDTQEDNSGSSQNGESYGYNPEDDYYYTLTTILREDLDYSVTFEEIEYYEDNAYVYCTYPVLEGDIPNIDYLNQVIYDEYLYFVQYYEENVKDYMWEDDTYDCYIEGYVTYMDEEKISIVFSEDGEWGEYFLLSLYCINIDVENGVVLDNTEILDVNDEFSVDFRIREGEQNQSDMLDVYTDQEVTEMLTDPIDLILFYTPLGMEVGVNHDSGWSTATYKDYENYLKRF